MIALCNRLQYTPRPKANWIFLCVIVSVLFIFYVQENSVLFNRTIRLIDDRSEASNTSYSSFKSILLWNGLPGNMGQLLGSGRSPFIRLGCQINQCFIEEKRKTTNSKRSTHHKMSLKHYDAVLFNMNMIKSRLYSSININNYHQ